MTRRAPTLREVAARFWSSVDVRGPDDCWLWRGTANWTGYGSFYVEAGRVTGAHRFAWELENFGPVPAGLFVCHRCDVKRCVNPAHLWLGTNADNLRDWSEKRRARLAR